jgi:hypothetical protein
VCSDARSITNNQVRFVFFKHRSFCASTAERLILANSTIVVVVTFCFFFQPSSPPSHTLAWLGGSLTCGGRGKRVARRITTIHAKERADSSLVNKKALSTVSVELPRDLRPNVVQGKPRGETSVLVFVRDIFSGERFIVNIYCVRQCLVACEKCIACGEDNRDDEGSGLVSKCSSTYGER